MGKASKWFRGLLGLKKPDSQLSQPQPQPQPEPQTPTVSSKAKPPKKKWSFVKSYREKDQLQPPRTPVVADREEDPSKHAIAVAAATAAVAEAAVAAAQAAAEVVRLTSSGRAISRNASAAAAAASSTNARVASFGSAKVSPGNVSVNGGGYGTRDEWAAVMIQSHFRAYLSRRALRALKALVKLQAIVRGRIERRRNASRELLIAHTLASVGRVGIFESPHKASHIHYTGPATPEKFEHISQAKSMNQGENLIYRRSGSKNKCGSNIQNCRMAASQSWEIEGSTVKPAGSKYDEMNDKILEIDNGKPHQRRNLFHSSHLSIGSDHQTVQTLSPYEVNSMSPLKLSCYVDENAFCTAESSPQFHSTSTKGENPRRGPFTPTRSDGSRSCLSGYSDCPNYMSCTESSKAKSRSLSAPRQRLQYERSSSTKRLSIHGYGESRVNHPQRVSALQANFTSKAYPGSGRLDRLGMPIREEAAVGFSGGLWHRF